MANKKYESVCVIALENASTQAKNLHMRLFDLDELPQKGWLWKAPDESESVEVVAIELVEGEGLNIHVK